MKTKLDELREEDRCKTCKTGLHLYCPHEVELIKKHEREAILKDVKAIKLRKPKGMELPYLDWYKQEIKQLLKVKKIQGILKGG